MPCVEPQLAVRPARSRARRLRRAGLLLTGALAIGVPAAGPGLAFADTAADARTDTFLPAADARVEEAHPDASLGSITRLGSDGDGRAPHPEPPEVLRRGGRRQIEHALLRLFVVSDGTSDGPAVYPTTNGWTETGVTWRNRPAAA